MRLWCAFTHYISEFFSQLFFLFLIHIVFVFRRFPYFEHILAVTVEQPLCGLVLHDAAPQFIEVDGVRIAEPVVDDHGQIQMVFCVCLDIEVDGQLHDEIVLVELGEIFVLSDAKMYGERLEPATMK